MQVNPYLVFSGQCEAAFKFYQQCLGGKIETMIPFGETPAAGHAPPNWQTKIMHASLTVGENLLMGSDAPPDRYQAPQGFSVSLQIKEPAEAERVFQALAQNGTVAMAIQQTFWSVRFGMLTDQFVRCFLYFPRDGYCEKI
jgi:PhnB protein